MAEAVISSIAEKIIEILGSQAIQIVGKLWDVKHDELKALGDTISILQPILASAEEQYHQNPDIQVWVEKLKDAFYEAEDVLEEFRTEAMRRELRGRSEMMKEVRTFFSSSNQLAFNWKMSDKVRAVRMRIENIKAHKLLSLEEHPKREWRNREETYSRILKEDIIGRDNDREKVMNFLLDSNVKENVSILPIVGIGGIGKTTLAKYVYGESEFELKMWVCVSFDFDMEKIVKKMLACAKNEEPTDRTMEVLHKKLMEEIDGKKYLLVLDDVWDIKQETWGKLKALWVGGARGSKILITTRLTSVAMIIGTEPFFLKGLSDRASLKLLMQMAGQKIEERQNSDMLAIGEAIVRKCYGVPLVVQTIGSLLFFKRSKLEWSLFKDNELSKLSQSEDDIMSVLRLSYYHLPSHLKQCFAFCSLFPKDYEINKQILVDLWVAEGFVRPQNNSKHLEDIAHEYFMNLLWSNFFQDFKKDPYTNEETCTMHHLMHDLACSVAGTECKVASVDTKSIHERTRHVSMGDLPISCLEANPLRARHVSMGDLLISRLEVRPLRTLLFVERCMRSEADLCQLIQSFKRLHILDLHDTDFKKLPRSICELKYLTYLDLSHNESLERLPNSITELQNLQMLNLNGCYSLEELPRGIRKLVSLRNLGLNKCSQLSYLPRGLGELSFLHWLERFILPKDKARAKDYGKLGELYGLNNIRGSLCIENLGHVTDAVEEYKAANLKGKQSLESLELKWGGFDTDDAVIGTRDEALLNELQPHLNLGKLTISGYGGESFPRWMMDSLVSSLPNLVEVCFYDCRRCKHFPPLSQLRDLKLLRMQWLIELEYIEPDHSSTLTSFHSLSKLEIDHCEKLKVMPLTHHLEELKLTHANGALLINQMRSLNKLKKLEIWEMKFLECLPEECFQSLASLEYLDIRNCHHLTSLSQGLRHLTSLVVLSISECEELDISKDKSGNILDFHGLQSLRSVKILHLPKLASLPQWLLQACNLRHLYILGCHNLKDIPEQIEALRSLQMLEIRGSPLLTLLPEGMRMLTSLTHLQIHNCR